MTNGPIAVVGATGYTGGRVLASLARRCVSVRLVGRNNERLTRAASVPRCERLHPGSRSRWVRRWKVAPPSSRAPGHSSERDDRPWRAHCRPAYPTPTTGEQPFIRHVFDELDRPAKEARLPLVPAFGFDYPWRSRRRPHCVGTWAPGARRRRLRGGRRRTQRRHPAKRRRDDGREGRSVR